MRASPRAKSSEFASATMSGSVLHAPTHFAKAAWSAAVLGSGWCGVPFLPGGRSVGCNTIFLSCASEGGASEDGVDAGLLDDAGLLPLDVEAALDVELPQAVSVAMPQPTAH